TPWGAHRRRRQLSGSAACRAERLSSGVLLAVACLEAGDAAAGVQDLLLAGVERVARGAHLGADHTVGLGAAGGERVAAGAGHLGLDVCGVDLGLHVSPCSGSLGRRPAGAVNQNRRHSLPRPAPRTRGLRVRRAQHRGVQLEARTSSRYGTVRWAWVPLSGTVPSSMPATSETVARATASMSMLKVVSSGVTSEAISSPSTPTSRTRPGTATSSSRRARSSRTASPSL